MISLLLAFPPLLVSSPGDEAPVLALKGLDPVELVAGREVSGKDEVAAVRHGYRYLFATPASRALFEKDPEACEIQFGGGCGRMGPLSGRGRPERWLVHEKRIYIFASDACRVGFARAPEKHLDQPDPVASGTPEAKAKGKALVERAVEAAGGAARIDALKSYRAHFSGKQKTGETNHAVTDTLTFLFPDAVRAEESWDESRWGNVLGPEGAFLFASKECREMVPSQRATFLDAANRQLVTILRARTRPDFSASSLGADRVGDREVEKVAVSFGGSTTTLSVDPENGRVLRLCYHGRPGSGPLGDVEVLFSDFRPVGGLTLPFTSGATFEGKPYPSLTRTLASIEVDGNLDPALFRRPRG